MVYEEYKKEKKLRSLSKRLEELVNGGTPQRVYDNLQLLMQSQSDYFKTFDALFLVKLVFYIYSYKRTKDFELAVKMCDRLFFTKLLEPTEEHYQENCSTCGGDGDIECNECYGSGQVDCHNCGRTGVEECYDCEGSGEVEDSDEEDVWHTCQLCGGKGEVECHTCDGDMLESCGECQGNGRESCYDCSGSGEVESEELNYNSYSICSWDKDIYNKCELNLNTPNPALSNSEFSEFDDKFIVLHYEEDHDMLIEDLPSDNNYCFLLENQSEVDLDISRSMKIIIMGEPYQYIQ